MSAGLRSQAGARIVTQLEVVWAAIRRNHPQIPPAVIITGTGTGRRRKKTEDGQPPLTLGHHRPNRWRSGPENPLDPELFIAGETIALGAETVLETLLHEGAHALAAATGVEDTSAQRGRYHNKKFMGLAVELGLVGPERPDKVLGWSECVLGPVALKRYGRELAGLRKADLSHLPYGENGTAGAEPEKSPKDKTSRKNRVMCGCSPETNGQPERRLFISPKTLEAGAILCGVCSEPFEPAPLEEDQAQAEPAAAEPVG